MKTLITMIVVALLTMPLTTQAKSSKERNRIPKPIQSHIVITSKDQGRHRGWWKGRSRGQPPRYILTFPFGLCYIGWTRVDCPNTLD